jgi:hypothetical protein
VPPTSLGTPNRAAILGGLLTPLFGGKRIPLFGNSDLLEPGRTSAPPANIGGAAGSTASANSHGSSTQRMGSTSVPAVGSMPIHIGDLTYVITKVEIANSVGKGMQKKNADAGATYVLVYYSVRNNGSETVKLPVDDFTVTTNDGTVVKPDSKARGVLPAEDRGGMFGLEVHPGVEKKSVTVFKLLLSQMQQDPVMYIGEVEGGHSVALIPLAGWKGQALANWSKTP